MTILRCCNGIFTLQTLLTSAVPNVGTSVCSLGRIWHSGETPLTPSPCWVDPSFFWCFLPVRCGELPWFGALGGLSTEKWVPIPANRDEQLQDICHGANLKRYMSTCCNYHYYTEVKSKMQKKRKHTNHSWPLIVLGNATATWGPCISKFQDGFSPCKRKQFMP